jgi:hypothetical protein
MDMEEDLDYSVIIKELSNEPTEELLGRFEMILLKICKHNHHGIKFRHISAMTEILDMFYERVDGLPAVFTELVRCLLRLCGKAFVRERTNEELSAQESIVSLVQVVVMYLNKGGFYSLQIEACNTLTSLLQMEKEERHHHHHHHELNLPLHLRIKQWLVNTREMNLVFEAFHEYSERFLHDLRSFRKNSASKTNREEEEEKKTSSDRNVSLALNQTLCYSFLALVEECATFKDLCLQMVQHQALESLHFLLRSSDKHGLVDSLLPTCCSDDLIVRVVEVIWSCLQAVQDCRDRLPLSLDDCWDVTFAFRHFLLFFQGLVEKGFRETDRELRNELLVLLMLIHSLSPTAQALFIERDMQPLLFSPSPSSSLLTPSLSFILFFKYFLLLSMIPDWFSK